MRISLVTKNVKNGGGEISYPVKITYDDVLAAKRIDEAPALCKQEKRKILKQNAILFITLLFLYPTLSSYLQRFYSEVRAWHVLLSLAILRIFLWHICAAFGVKDSFFAQCLFFKSPTKKDEDFYSLNEKIHLMRRNYENLFAVRVFGDKEDVHLEVRFSDCSGLTEEIKIFLRELQFEHKVGISEIEVDLVEGKITLPLAPDSNSNRNDTTKLWNGYYFEMDQHKLRFSESSQLSAYSYFNGGACIYYDDERGLQKAKSWKWWKNSNPFKYECKSRDRLYERFMGGDIHNKIYSVTRVFPQFVGVDCIRKYGREIYMEYDFIVFTNALGMNAAVIVDFSEFEVDYRLDSNMIEIDFANKKVICPSKMY